MQIMNEVGSLNSSHDLQIIRAKIYINRFYLILQINKILFQKIWQSNLNTSLIQTVRTRRSVTCNSAAAHIVLLPCFRRAHSPGSQAPDS